MGRKPNPNSPYLGMRGGWKGGGRPKKIRTEDDCEKRISVRVPVKAYEYITSLGESISDYLRKLIEVDMKENRFIDGWNKGK